MRRSLPTYFDTNTEPVDRRIATALYKIGLAMKHQSWALAAGDNVSPTQGQILAILATQGALTGKELAERLGITLPTVSDSVKALVDKGLAGRRPDPRHHRAQLIELTASGKALAARVSSWPDFLAAAAGTLSPDEQGAFLSGLVKMIRELQEREQIPVTRMCVTCTHFRPNVRAGAQPHHCALVDAPMAATQLRVECTDHEAANAEQRAVTWQQFITPR